MEALHRQVLPFLLRRMKEDVLQDLPPKIIQDYYCILSPLQVCLKSGWKPSIFFFLARIQDQKGTACSSVFLCQLDTASDIYLVLQY